MQGRTTRQVDFLGPDYFVTLPMTILQETGLLAFQKKPSLKGQGTLLTASGHLRYATQDLPLESLAERRWHKMEKSDGLLYSNISR